MYNRDNIFKCIFVKRKNRFVATVILDDETIDVHVKNTGRCIELLIPGSIGYLVKSENLKRKYAYDLVAIYKGEELVNFDSQLPNEVVTKFIENGNLFSNVTKVKREVTYGKSRFDVYVERLNDQNQIEKIFVEVKGVTLYDNQVASFPDAPTVRGAKHVEELGFAVKEGYKCYIFFLVQTENVTLFKPNAKLDPNFAKQLQNAVSSGVEILCYNSVVKPDLVTVKEKIKVEI